MLTALSLLLLLSACGGASGGTAGGTKVSPRAGASGRPASGGGGGGGGSSATLDITVSGAISGHSTQLDSNQKNDCVEPGAAVTIGTYPLNLYPVISGKTYQFSFLVGKFKGPVTIQFPDKSNVLLLYIADKAGGDLWGPSDKSTGSFVMNPDTISGHADIKAMTALAGTTSVDLAATWNCPPKR